LRFCVNSPELGWPYGKVPVIVLSHRALMTDRENVEFNSGGLEKLVNGWLKPTYRNIWVAGGANATKEFI
jgi:dihydrofolate reductase